MFLGLTLIKVHRETEAASALEKALTLNPENLEALAYMGQAKAVLGDRDGAIEAIEKLRTTQDHYEPALLVASVLAALGDANNMFKYLRIVYEQKCAPMYLVALRTTSFWHHRSDPRYVAYLGLLGLPQA